MKILFLTSHVPHLAAAGEKKTYKFLNELGRNGYKVDVVYFRYQYEDDYIPESENVKIILKFYKTTLGKVKNILNFPVIHPEISVRFNWRILNRIKRIYTEEYYDLIICNHTSMFLYGKFLDNKVPKLLISHDVMLQKISRGSSKLMQKICFFSEKFVLKTPNSYVFAPSEKDCQLINNHYNLPSFLFLDYIDDLIIKKQPEKVEDYYVFFGDWHRPENYEGVIWFMEKVVPLLDEPINVKIIGRKFPVKYLETSSEKVKIEYLGYLDDPYHIISQSRALISPLFKGAGIKVKVIESLACGIPVIGSKIAFEGLPIEFSAFMILANEPADYIKAFTSINLNIEDRRKIKETFIKSYNKETILSFIKENI